MRLDALQEEIGTLMRQGQRSCPPAKMTGEPNPALAHAAPLIALASPRANHAACSTRPATPARKMGSGMAPGAPGSRGGVFVDDVGASGNMILYGGGSSTSGGNYNGNGYNNDGYQQGNSGGYGNDRYGDYGGSASAWGNSAGGSYDGGPSSWGVLVQLVVDSARPDTATKCRFSPVLGRRRGIVGSLSAKCWLN